MEKNIIVEEYLNNFFTYEELALYLGIDINVVTEVLDTVGGRYGELVSEHKNNISRYYNEEDVVTINDKKDELTYEIANYIIETGSSVRKTAETFGVGKTTVHEYMKNRLPNVSIKLYKKVFDIMMGNKSLNAEYKEVQDVLLKEIELLDSGMTLVQIGKVMNKSFSSVHRDLSYRTTTMGETTNAKVKQKLAYNNEIKWFPKTK